MRSGRWWGAGLSQPNGAHRHALCARQRRHQTSALVRTPLRPHNLTTAHPPPATGSASQPAGADLPAAGAGRAAAAGHAAGSGRRVRVLQPAPVQPGQVLDGALVREGGWPGVKWSSTVRSSKASSSCRVPSARTPPHTAPHPPALGGRCTAPPDPSPSPGLPPHSILASGAWRSPRGPAGWAWRG